MMIKLAIVSGVVGAVVVILAGILGFVVLPNVVDDKIEGELKLVPGTDVWNKWSDIGSPIYTNFYMFNITNADAVIDSGAKPVIQQVGPYAYRQSRYKLEPHLGANCKDTVKYQQRIQYYFDQEKSGNNKETDIINIFNVPFVSVIEKIVKDVGTATAGALATGFLAGEQIIRKNVMAGDVAFHGFPVPAYDNSVIGPNLPPEFEGFRFGIYKGKNGSHDGMYEIFTGVHGSDKFGQIRQWRESSNLGFWGEDEYQCNNVTGASDGSLFTPFKEEGDSITVFSSELCRTLKLDFKETAEVNGIKTYRYAPKKEELQGPENNRANECYCRKSNIADCRDGTIDVSLCRGGSPILLSTPHFLDGDKEYADAMGLIPNREQHETIIDIEPRTGLLIQAHKRIQINLEATPFEYFMHPEGIPQYTHLTGRTVLPVLWIDEEAGMCELDADDYKSRIANPIKAINITKWVFIGVGIVLLVGAVGLFIMGRRRAVAVTARKSLAKSDSSDE